ncbi:MAG: dipeptide/oligopeptide/nickel ABC transporter permease/ATP-binding protein [Candidatus Nanopelagicales bacterium]
MAAAAPVDAPTTRPVEGSVRRLLRNPLGVVSGAILLVIILVSLLAPLIAPYDPNQSILTDTMAPISPEHWLGADRAGRDSFSRLIWGGQVTLLAAALAVVIAMLIGIPTGLLAGYYGRWFDTTTSWVNDLIMALPGIVILLAVRSVAGPSVWLSMAVFGVLLAPSFYRLVRTTVADVRNELYVDAARVSGLGDFRIIARHVLTVVRAPIVIQAALVAAIALTVQSGLEFLGVGDPRVPTWGALLNEAFRNIYVAPHMLVWPGLALALMCACLALFANAVRDALEDRGLNTARRRRVAKAGAATSGIATVSEAAAAVPPVDVEAELEAEEAPTAAVAMGAGVPVRLAPGEADGALLVVDGLEVAYQQPDGSDVVVVHDVSFTVRSGEVLGIVGESGSGKTQTAFSVLGLLPSGGHVTDGRILLDGVDLATMSRKQRSALLGTAIGYIPQEPMSNLDPSYRIGSQLDDPLRLRHGMSKKEARERSLALLERVGIPDPERTYRSYPHEISGGMAQRVLIAGAVAGEPKLLIADECTTALDVTVQAEVLDLLRDLQRERHMGIILVTHNFGVVADLCDRVAVMQRGQIVEVGEAEQIFEDPQHPYTRMLLDSTLDESELREPLGAQTGGRA